MSQQHNNDLISLIAKNWNKKDRFVRIDQLPWESPLLDLLGGNIVGVGVH